MNIYCVVFACRSNGTAYEIRRVTNQLTPGNARDCVMKRKHAILSGGIKESL